MGKNELNLRGEIFDVTQGQTARNVEVRKPNSPPSLKLRVPHHATVYGVRQTDGTIRLEQDPPVEIVRRSKIVRGHQEIKDTSPAFLGRRLTINQGEKVPSDVRTALSHVRDRWGWNINGKLKREQ